MPEIGSDYSLAQRIGLINPAARAEMMRILAVPVQLRTQEQHNILHSLARSAARMPNLSYPTGIAFERGMLDWKDSKYQAQRGDSLKFAADHYAALHRAVWGPLPKVIEEAMTEEFGPGAFNLLLQVGRVKGPGPVTTIFKNLVGETPNSFSDSDPEEARKKRWRSSERFWEARKELSKVGALRIVEDTVIEGIFPIFLIKEQEKSPMAAIQRGLFFNGLFALAKKFGLIEE